MSEPCKYCKPLKTIRNATFFEHFQNTGDLAEYGGLFGIIAIGDTHYLRYQNSFDASSDDDIDTYVDEFWKIGHCPICGRDL